ncbi:hypothetical protein DL769_007401 [Monosporascus sp. CRB-8-3]|nr:hypothetical protein DL769_007401 [Monosporascus sp. CRB-8-3]
MDNVGSPGDSHVYPWANFNPAFLAYAIICCLLAIFFLLYFNRAFASVVSRLIRAYTWHRYRIYIDFTAIQISLLAGRVFFIGLRYHGNNETILVQNGYVTWSYWLRRVRDASIDTPEKRHRSANGATTSDSDAKKAKLPCRISVNVSGVQWFVYNRSAAYDVMLDAITVSSKVDNGTIDGTEGLANGGTKPRQRMHKSPRDIDSKQSFGDGFHSEKPPVEGGYSGASHSDSVLDNGEDRANAEHELPLMLQLFPVHFHCNKAALVMGNENTKAVFITKADSVSGEIDAARCSTPDPYRQLFKIQLEHPVVEMRENETYKEDQFSRAMRDTQVALDSGPVQHRSFFRRQRRKVLGQVRNLVPYWRRSVESFSVNSRDGGGVADAQVPGSSHWQGLSRYLNDDDADDKLRWSAVEYAAVNTIVDSPEATLTLLWDVPGRVSRSHGPNGSSEDEGTRESINGAAAPAWQISLSLGGGVVNYGPWADRQRAELQRVFFPSPNKDAIPATKLPVGADRVPTVFNFYVELDEEVIVRVPTREDSKNWRWKEAATLRQHSQQEQRRDQGREPGPAGYSNTVKIDLPATEVSTSVNHGVLWKSGAQRISCDLSTPLKWNGLRTWRFDVDSDELELFILRDHIFLLTDLIDDWGSGPPADYLLFTPFKYLLDAKLRNLKLYLNVNDPLLNSSLHVPPWNTQASFLTCKEIGRLENLIADGEYHYNATTSSANTDTLVLNVSGQSPTLYLYGFLVRYFLQLKDNYFGDHIHFKTLDEYQQTLRAETNNPESAPTNRPPHKKSNDLDIILSVRADDPRILLPANLYSARRHVQIEAAALSADLRFTNYYMDLDLCLSPLSLSLGNDDGDAATPVSAASRTQLFVDGLTIYGHRLFGLPPIEPTYLCNWDLSVGAVTGECSADFLMALVRGGKAFGFSLDDDENALVTYSSIVVRADISVPDLEVACTAQRESIGQSGTPIPHDDSGERRDPLHSTVAFSSQYFAPYFPLESVRPDSGEATLQSIERDEGEDEFDSTFSLEDIDPNHLSQDSVHQSFLLEFPPGITAFLNAPSLPHIVSLLSALQPTEPEDILDTLQVTTMSDIFDMQKRRVVKGRITEFLVRLPRASLRFLNCSGSDASDILQSEQDQYDVTLKALALAVRSEAHHQQSNEEFKPGASRLSFNLRLASADISAAERLADIDETQAAVLAGVESIMVSMGTKEVSYLDVDVGSIRTVSSSGKIEYLASLIHRTSVLASKMGKLFSSTVSKEDERLRQFTYRVISEGQGASDPSFVVRPSAILRAASDHLRTYDSWKLVTRLRQMWSALHRNTKEDVSRDCLYGSFERPANAREQVMAAFERWRSWDLDNLAHTVLLDNIFGKSPDSAGPATDRAPFMLVVRVQEIQFVLDPGPKQNQIFLVDLTVRGEEKITGRGESHGGSGTPEDPLTVVNIFCSQAGMNLNWELCRLADDMLKLYKEKDAKESAEEHTAISKAPKSQPSRSPRSFHVVAVLMLGSIRLESINLVAEARTNELKLSVLATNATRGITNTNIILGCDATTTKIRSQSQSLVSLRLKRPSVFVAHELSVDGGTAIHSVKATASSQDMRLLVKQDPIVLSEVVDMLVRDEAAQLYELQQQFPSSSPSQNQKPKVTERLTTFRVDLAMFLDSYTITVPLLRSLTYTIKGIVSRAAMAANFGKEIILNFDVKENSHEMQININNAPRTISLLQIPPTNGRVTSRMAPGEHSITVFASLELVQLDASAVYSLLAALNRPEISSTISDLQQQGRVIREHVNEIFGPSSATEPTSPVSNDSTLTYVVHSTLAGIQIFSTTPLRSDAVPSARLSFCLDSVHFEFANKLDNGPILDRPEVHVNLRKFSFDIEKGSAEKMRSCGNVAVSALITATSRESEDGANLRAIDFESNGLEVNLSPETVSTFVDVLGYMGDRIKDLDTSRELEYLRKLRQSRPRITINDKEEEPEKDIFDSFLASIMYSFVIRDIQVAWLVSKNQEAVRGEEDLVLSFKKIEFTTRRKKTAKLTIEDLQLQMVPPGQERPHRSLNSAFLPEVILNLAYVSTSGARRLAFQAIGKPLDIRLTSAFIIPASHLQSSISLSTKNIRQASRYWTPIVLPDKQSEKLSGQATETTRSLFGSKRLESLLIDADFAGAVVRLSAKKPVDSDGTGLRASRPALAGKYGQFSNDESGSSTNLRSPGLALKLEYRDDGQEDPTLYGEVKVDASRNKLYPSVVPLILDITSSIKEVVSDDQMDSPHTPSTPSGASGDAKSNKGDGDNILTADPSAVLGRVKLNLGLRICRQEFTLSCEPIGRVTATACFEDIYITCNTVHSTEQGNFFAISGTFSNLHTAVQHVYSQGSTASFAVDSLVLSLMNSKHVSGTSGVSAILKVSPMAVAINAKQLQDFLLFREIWLPREVRRSPSLPLEDAAADVTTQGHLMQRYQQVAATAAFPWTATVSIGGLDVAVDLGQALGKSKFGIENLWLSSKKTSDWEQNLCLGFDQIGVDSTGRLGGFVALQDFRLRTLIQWPERERALNETPRIQASIGFSQFKMKTAFDFQAFLMADIRSLSFLMYNVRRDRSANGDRLVATLDGDAVQIFGTTSSAAQSVALWKAIQRLIQERKASFETSLRDIEKFTRRKSMAGQEQSRQLNPSKPAPDDSVAKSPISLDTDVVVTLKALNLGVFPNTFSDHQVFKLEALNAQARFAASIERRRIHSILGLTLGQLRIGLAGVRQEAPKSVNEISVEHVVASATGSRGGTILKVPKVEAVMQTWQQPDSRTIEYIFKSAFEGKVEVGWNYSRISFIRGMWATHSKALATIWGREIPAMSAIKVTGVGLESGGDRERDAAGGREHQQQKITAEVNVPQSKYEYVPLEPPVIETPQLRDMGEATPPLEWIGLHRERLPNLTHQIAIVSLLELAGEVEEAYSKILGSS